MPWVKGQSGNPGGRPKTKLVSQEIARQLRQKAVKGSPVTNLQMMVAKAISMATIGDHSYFKTLVEYMDGKPTQPIEVRQVIERMAALEGLDPDEVLAEAERITAEAGRG